MPIEGGEVTTMNDDQMQSRNAATMSTVAVAAGVTTAASSELICECHQPGPEMIDIEQVLAAEMRQKVVEFDMWVPDRKPDIGQIVDVYVKDVEIKTIDVIPNKVIVRGDMRVKVMYVANLPNEPVHAIEMAHVKFTRDIDVEGAMPQMKATADCTVEYVDYDFSECEPRKAHVTIVLKFWTRVTTTTEMEIYALSPVDQMGVTENTTASASVESMANSYQFTETQVSSEQMGSTNFANESMQKTLPSVPEGEIVVTEPEAIAGTNLSINGTMGTVSGNRVNVRTGPGTNYPSLTKVNRGDVVTIKEQAFGWYKVVLPDGNTTGWIAGWFVNTDI